MHGDLLDEGVDVVWADRDTDPDVIAFRQARDEIRSTYCKRSIDTTALMTALLYV